MLLPKIHNLSIIMWRHQTKPNLRDILWNQCSVLFKYQCHKRQRRTEELLHIKGNSKDLTSECDTWPCCDKGHLWDIWWHFNEVITLNNGIISIIILIIILWLYKRISLILGNAHWSILGKWEITCVTYCKIVQKINYTPSPQYTHRGNNKANRVKCIFGFDHQENECK